MIFIFVLVGCVKYFSFFGLATIDRKTLYYKQGFSTKDLFVVFFFSHSVVALYFFSAFFLNFILAVTFYVGANATILCKSAADLSLLEKVS